MNKKQILATILSGLISLNTLTACVKNDNEDTTIIEEGIDSTTTYSVSVANAPSIYDKEGRISYYIPLTLKSNGYLLEGNKIYRVESTTVREYDGLVKNDVIKYTDNKKRERSKDGKTVIETEIKALDEEEAREFLIEHNYIESNEKTLKKVK